MSMARPILVAVALQNDEMHSAHASAVREVAAKLARVSSAPLHVVSVYAYAEDRWRGFPGASGAEWSAESVEQTDEVMRERIAEYVAPLEADGLAVTTHLQVGDPGETIVHLAGEVEAALIIIGTHSRRSVFDVVLGGTAAYVNRHAPCTVVLVQPERGQAEV
jgi:nucleotide-binding universal stress UspA family protein